jgi:hypothetical protein
MLKRILLLALAIVLIAAPAAESIAAGNAPVAGAAKKKKKKKCKSKKKKGKKKGKKCKKSGGGGSGGLPGKPNPPKLPGGEDPDDPVVLRLIQSLSLNDNPLLGGTSGTAQVILASPAPTGGQPVTLGSADTTRVTVPDSVHVAAGQTTASFPVDTTVGPPTSVELTAATPDSVRHATLDVVDKASLKSLALDYQCFPDTGLSDFGNNVVALNVKAPDVAVVDLESDDPFSLSVPSTVSVPQGSFTGTFGVNTLQTTPAVTVTATYDGVSKSDIASVRDSSSPPQFASSLGLQPASVVVGDPSTGTVSLNCEAPPGGVIVSLSTGYTGVNVPTSVSIPAGELSATFPITTVVSAVPGDAVIQATAGATVQATLTLRAIGT